MLITPNLQNLVMAKDTGEHCTERAPDTPPLTVHLKSVKAEKT